MSAIRSLRVALVDAAKHLFPSRKAVAKPSSNTFRVIEGLDAETLRKDTATT